MIIGKLIDLEAKQTRPRPCIDELTKTGIDEFGDKDTDQPGASGMLQSVVHRFREVLICWPYSVKDVPCC